MDDSISLFNRAIAAEFFWSIPRHQIIADAAQKLLKQNQTALDEIGRILKPLKTDRLAAVAGWADTVKRRKPNPAKDDSFTVEFLESPKYKELNALNDTWHYVNLPLDAGAYDREKYKNFTRDDDVVQILKEAIRVLKTKGKHDRFSEVNALRLVTHLAGDIHQPVHVGCCYINTAEKPPQLVADPEFILKNKLRHDAGGNDLILPVSGSPTLHSYWDGQIFEASQFAGGDAGFAAPAEPEFTETDENKLSLISSLGEIVVRQIQNSDERAMDSFAGFAGTEIENLPAQWATETLATARLAYEGLRIADVKNAGGKTKYLLDWGSGGQKAYNEKCQPVAGRQSALASINLAALLKAIWS